MKASAVCHSCFRRVLAVGMMALSLVPFAASADTVTVGSVTWAYSVSNGKAIITESSATTGDLVIPSTLCGYPVSSIGVYAFQHCSGLTSVTIPDGVTSIGTDAFEYCSRLKSVTIPPSVENIRKGAFYGCRGLESVRITDLAAWCRIDFGGNAANPLYYAHRLYLNDTEVTDLTIPSNVKSVGSSVFSGCSGLKSVTIPANVKNIGNDAFFGCRELESVTIPPGVKSIGDWTFYGCSGLESVTIPASVTSIGEYAFRGCRTLETVTIPEGVMSIGSSAFNGCSGLKSVTIPASVVSIGSDAFYGCRDLESVRITDLSAWCQINFGSYDANPLRYAHRLYLNDVEVIDLTIPASVTSIGDYAFSGCSGLKSVTIPSSVTSIQKGAFSGCSGLESVRITDLAAWCRIDFGGNDANPLYYAHELYLNDVLAQVFYGN